MADIVDDFILNLRSLAPDFPLPVALQLEVRMRQAWGGTEPYVAQRPALQRSVKVGEGLRSKRPIGDVFVATGVSRATWFRTLGRK